MPVTVLDTAIGHPTQQRRHKAGAAIIAWITQQDYWVMSTSLVSRRNRVPITTVIRAMPIGYHNP